MNMERIDVPTRADGPNRYIYIRCSTDKQDYMQQLNTIHKHLNHAGIGTDRINGIVAEKEHGDVAHDKRQLDTLLNQSKRGDYIYVSELSRLGRSMNDVFSIVSKACEIGREEAEAEDKQLAKKLKRRLNDNEKAVYGVTIIQCKDGSVIENRSVGGKALLFALSLAAELELDNIRQRTRSAINAIQEKLSRGEKYVSKKGNIITHLGRPKGVDLEKAYTASAISRREKARNEPNNKIIWGVIGMGGIPTSEETQRMSVQLNRMGVKTASGLEFTPERVRTAYHNMKKYMI